ncbi:NACHT domain-containing protein [Methanosphaerula subterraneus]|uniref:NACHT domain-containing protein n=1 Tax=Methanosphaerula subterraneus TaxID=3350244 RepID=UPI003F864F00
MGKIFDTFGSMTHQNEADVNQNFVIPLLNTFLGFSLEEIKPERFFPAFDIPIGRRKINSKEFPQRQKPDFIVCIGDEGKPKFVVESKAVTEKLDDHIPQAVSYASGVKVNFIVLTNGKEFQIYDANNQIFIARTIEELDLKFDIVKSILSRECILEKNPIEIIQSIDYDRSLSISFEEKKEAELIIKHLKISDFKVYLSNISKKFSILHNPFGFLSYTKYEMERFPPEKLLKFETYPTSQSSLFPSCENETFILSDIDNKLKSQLVILIGDSGIGKTTLLKYLAWIKSNECLYCQNMEVPIYIQLRQFGLNNSLESLIIHSLADNGLDISEIKYHELLKKNQFFFLLDAYDEIPEKYLDDFNVEFERFLSSHPHRIIITSRKLRIPRYKPSKLLWIAPLDSSTIEQFLQIYLKNQWLELYNQIKWKNLVIESQNTLLLTLIIIIFREHHELPHSRPQIIKKIVENIKKWEESKRERFSLDIPWEIKEHLLRVLAFECAKREEKVYFTSDEFRRIIRPILEDYRKKGEINSTYLNKDIVNNLRSTGLINESNNEISFSHRAFLEYFASIELARQYQFNQEILKEFSEKLSWNKILLGASGFLSDSTDFIQMIYENNIYLAALCIIESNYVDPIFIEKNRSYLVKLCSSPIINRRQRGIFLLSKIEQKFPSDVLYKIVDENRYVDVRQFALENIARTKTQKAKEKVYDLLNWDERSQHIITGVTVPGSIAIALSNFSEEEHLKIIEIWETQTDLFTRGSCKSALLEVIREGRLTEKLKREIFNFYFKNLKKNVPYRDTHNISGLIIEINDDNFVNELIDIIPSISKEEFYFGFFNEILAGYTSEKVINILISIASDTTKHKFLRECCSDALSKTKGIVPIKVFNQLILDVNPIIRRNAVLGLDRFPRHQIKEILFAHIDDENELVQKSLVEVIGERGLLGELIENGQFPKTFYLDSVETLLEKIRKFNHRELIPFVTDIKDRISDERLLIDLSFTYCVLGDFKTAKQIIESFYDDNRFKFSNYGLADLIKIAPHFENTYAFNLIQRSWISIDDPDDNFYYRELCLQALQQIGTNDASSFLKEKAEEYAEKKKIFIIEEIFRSLNSIASNRDEEWYINYIKKYSPFENMDFHRIIEGLGQIGSDRSVKIIKEISTEYKDNEYILNICFISLETIKSKSGKFITVREEDLLT